ncbi:pectin lyase-like protein [Eremomyces bilateralis CBS 781.70]|uniref:Pectin lyase-like protein n=1 Tax=Eremomyces bilateralis CBS 781.70 TaxID=1392243 RepID=A0A6G1FX95_9PEZI|nr:pectin lyase-like protein [Eremomyces bilateralis CBS 781.70]KAF1810332.1 pectin lyase-like protein [Eremomyces bilateralis CBS 781.70]
MRAVASALLKFAASSILFSHLSLAGPTDPAYCAKCEESAPGFASLNGGTTGGKGGPIVTVTTHADLKAYAGLDGPYVIRVDRTLVSEPFGYEIPIKSHKTIIGVGRAGKITGGGLTVKNERNIIIRNLEISGTYNPADYDGKQNDFDGVQVDGGTNIWIDHCKFTQMWDGLLDLRKDTNYVTVSFTQFSEHNKAFGIGWTDNVLSKMTIHDNFFHSTNQRNPSADNLQHCHMYNNYFRNLTAYGTYARGATQLLVEASYYEDVNDPLHADATAAIRSNQVRFKDCRGKREVSARPEKVFKASDFYSYQLKNPDDLPRTVPGAVGPSPEIGIWTSGWRDR